MSYLTEPVEALHRDVIAALEGEGFAYNPLRTSWTEYLAIALGQPNANLRKSEGQLLTELDAAYGGSLSYLRVSIAQLIDDLTANIGSGGGGEVVPQPEIFAEFSTGVYEHNGSAVAVTDLFIGDEVNWGPFDPNTAIIPGAGLRNIDNSVGYPSVNPTLIGTLASVGCSVIIEAFLVGNESAVALCADAPDWTQDIECTMRATPGKVQSYVNGVTQDATDNVAGSTLTKIGMTFLSDRTRICIAGGTVDEDTFTDAGARSFIAFTAPVDGYFKSISIYAPLSDADLQSLTS